MKLLAGTIIMLAYFGLLVLLIIKFSPFWVLLPLVWYPKIEKK